MDLNLTKEQIDILCEFIDYDIETIDYDEIDWQSVMELLIDDIRW